MIKIIDYFYIFSKLTTSLVLIIIIFIMGYALINSYQDVDKNFVDIESQYEALSNQVSQSNLNYLSLKETTEDLKIQIIEFNEMLNDKLTNLGDQQYKEDINKLFKLNTLLKEKINSIGKNITKKNLKKEIKENINSQDQVKSLITLILFKYKNGQNIDIEILYLEDILPQEKIKILEKIKIIKIKKFYGLKKLKDQFELDTQNYVNAQFTNKNKNSIINYLFKFIDIKPSDLTIFENEELNILMEAKKFINKDDIKSSLSNILLLKDNNIFFYKWIEQTNLYINFTNEIEKVI